MQTWKTFYKKLSHYTPECLGYNFSTVKTLKDDIFTISFIGRPNVGKSSLLNRLGGGKFAVTDSMPGLTRDRKEIVTEMLGLPIRFVDTAGYEDKDETKNSEIKAKMVDQTAQALIYSDLALFLYDGKNGITSDDYTLARWIRSKLISKDTAQEYYKMKDAYDVRVKNVLLVANKIENEDYEDQAISDGLTLGFGDPLLVSAEHGDGITDLLAAIEEHIPESKREEFKARQKKRRKRYQELKRKMKAEVTQFFDENPEEFENSRFSIKEWEQEFDQLNGNPEENSDYDSDNEYDPEDSISQVKINEERGISLDNPYLKKTIQLSIVGRPNAGKSTFVNSVLKEDRVIADDLPGTTRDSIAVEWRYKGKKIKLVDTAGIERRIKNKSNVEKQIHADTERAIRYSHVVICMIDALEAYRVQDMGISQHILEEGRALVLVVNKWDTVSLEWRNKAKKYMKKQVQKFLGEAKEIPLYFVSALTGSKLNTVMDEVLGIYDKWNARISTALLNDWLIRFKKRANLPSQGENSLKIYFVTQLKSRPPTFVVFVNNKKIFKANYLKFMQRNLIEEFNMVGVPVRLTVRDVGYKDKKKKVEKIEKTGKMREKYMERRMVTSSVRKRMLKRVLKPQFENQDPKYQSH